MKKHFRQYKWVYSVLWVGLGLYLLLSFSKLVVMTYTMLETVTEMLTQSTKTLGNLLTGDTGDKGLAGIEKEYVATMLSSIDSSVDITEFAVEQILTSLKLYGIAAVIYVVLTVSWYFLRKVKNSKEQKNPPTPTVE